MKPTFRDVFQAILGAFVIASCVGYFFMVTLGISGSEKETVQQVMPIFNTIFSMIVGYYFGSSSNSQKKDETINTLTEKKEAKTNIENIENAEVK